MQTQAQSPQSRRSSNRQGLNLPSIAFDEHELAVRWRLSVKTLRRWRQEALGPAFAKMGSRVIYLRAQIEAFEQRASRFSTACRANG